MDPSKRDSGGSFGIIPSLIFQRRKMSGGNSKTPNKRNRLLSAHRSMNKYDALALETAYELNNLIEELKSSPEVIIYGLGEDREKEYLKLSESVSKTAEEIIKLLSHPDIFQVTQFKKDILEVTNTARIVAKLPYTEPQLSELLLGYTATFVNNCILFYESIIRVNNKNPMDISISLQRKAVLDPLTSLLTTLKDCFKTRCTKCKTLLEGSYFKVNDKSVCSLCYSCYGELES